MTVEEFGKAIVASGLVSAADLKVFWAAIPVDARPKSSEAFAKLLVDHGKINAFHAKETLSASGTPLVLGEYVLLAKIGAGGMGQVFKAQHRRMKRIVAVKILPAATTKDEASIRRFEREVELAARLVHPNIVSAYDAGMARGVHYLVMEFVEGRDLAHVAKAVGKLTLNQVTDFILQAARGLAYAHAEGVIHRDIKPSNLLLDKKGVVKILDMGLARFESIDGGAVAEQEGLTQSGQVMGTIDYMAPEQAFDTHHADARSDIYSLGCSMYRLLSGENVYGGESLVQKLLAHREKPIPDLCKLRADVPRAVDAIFKKMVAKDPADRYQHAADLVAALEEIRNPGSTASFDKKGLSQASAGSAAARPSSGAGSPVAAIDEDSSSSMSDSLLEAIALPEQTVTNASHDVDTELKAESRMGGGGKKPPFKLIAAGGAGALLVLLLGVWAIVRDKDNREVGRVEIPAGGKVEMVSDPPPAVKETPTTPEKPIGAPKDPLAKSASADQGGKAFNDPAFKQWMKEVAALPAEDRVDAVSKKLVELNPGFDGKVTGTSPNTAPKIVNGVVTEFGFITDDVADISPVRAFVGLKSLKCTGTTGNRGKVSSLSPLQGMGLKELSCYTNVVSDVSPLSGMPLTYLSCGATYISDLTPLEGAPLTSLQCPGTRVSDLSPLKGMHLKQLNCARTSVADLSPLQGMPLDMLWCYDTNVSDLSPLQGMNLRNVAITPRKIIKGIDVVRAMKSVTKINSGDFENFEPAEFWQKYDAGAFGALPPREDKP